MLCYCVNKRSSIPSALLSTGKHWMGSTHFLMRTLEHVSTEMSLHVLAYNMKRVISILGMTTLMEKMQA